MKTKLWERLLMIAVVLAVVTFCAVGFLGVWIDGCTEMRMVPYTCQFLYLIPVP